MTRSPVRISAGVNHRRRCAGCPARDQPRATGSSRIVRRALTGTRLPTAAPPLNLPLLAGSCSCVRHDPASCDVTHRDPRLPLSPGSANDALALLLVPSSTRGEDARFVRAKGNSPTEAMSRRIASQARDSADPERAAVGVVAALAHERERRSAVPNSPDRAGGGQPPTKNACGSSSIANATRASDRERSIHPKAATLGDVSHARIRLAASTSEVAAMVSWHRQHVLAPGYE